MSAGVDADVLRAQAAEDVPPRWVELLDTTVAADGQLAAALLRYNTADSPYWSAAFLSREWGDWGLVGEAFGLGPGAYYVGETGYPFLADAGRADWDAVEVAFAGHVVRRPVRNGHFLAVFWDVPIDEDGLESDTPELLRGIPSP